MLCILFRFAVFLLVIALAGTANAGGYRLRLGTFLPLSHLSNRAVLKPFADRVVESSKGMVTIEILASRELGSKPWEQLVLVEKGVVDIALIIPSYHPEMFADLDVVSLPNLIQNATQGSLALTRTYERGFIHGFERLIPLGMFTTHPAILHSIRCISTLQNLRGLSIRATDQMLYDVLRQLGARPISLPSSETYMALERGMIESIALSWRGIWEARIHNFSRFHYDMPLGAMPTLLVMSRYRFEKLPIKIQEALKKHAGEQLAEIWGRAYDDVNRNYRQRLEAQGHTIVTPSRNDNSHMTRITNQMISKWIAVGSHRREIIRAFRAELQRIQQR